MNHSTILPTPLLFFISLVMPAIPCQAKPGTGTFSKVLRKPAQEAGEQVLQSSVLRELHARHGDVVLQMHRQYGEDFLHALGKQGDEVFQAIAKATPEATQALARNYDEMLPILKSFGTEALELEARAPGYATKVFNTFGRKGGSYISKNVPTEDIPRLVSYGNKADAPATRQLLLKQYKQEGAGLFQRIPPKLVMASGLSASLLYGTHRATEPLHQIGDLIKEEKLNPEKVWQTFTIIFGGIGLAIAILLMMRFGLMPWQRPKPKASYTKSKEENVDTPEDTAEQNPEETDTKENRKPSGKQPWEV